MIMHPATTTSHESPRTSIRGDHVPSPSSLPSPSSSETDAFEFDPSGIRSSSSAAGSPGYDDDQDDGFSNGTMPGRAHRATTGGSQGSGTPPFPTMQMMERPDSSTSYRIPSSIFRTRSSTPGDWSVASNESLFSIHTGNGSFTREQLAWMERSDEQMFLRSDTELFFSGPLLDFSGYPTPNNQPSAAENWADEAEEYGIAGDNEVVIAQDQQQQQQEQQKHDQHQQQQEQQQQPQPQPQPGLSVNVTASKAGELPPIKKAKPLNADEFTKEISLAKGVAHSPASSRVSDDGSCKSFAFPVLARNDTSNDTSGLATPKQHVLPPGHSRKPTQPSSAKTKQQPEPEPEPPQPEPEPEPQHAKKQEAASTPAASFACCAWFSCFTGCGAAPRS